MKASKDRTEQFMHTTSNASVPPPATSTSLCLTITNPVHPSFHSVRSFGAPPASIRSLPYSNAPASLRTSSTSVLCLPRTQLTPDSLLFSQPTGPGAGFPSEKKGKARALPDDPDSKDFLALDLDGDRGENGQGGGYQQMQLVEQNVRGPFLTQPM
jgi:hypothetical protein